jgi:hypothetical protein
VSEPTESKSGRFIATAALLGVAIVIVIVIAVFSWLRPHQKSSKSTAVAQTEGNNDQSGSPPLQDATRSSGSVAAEDQGSAKPVPFSFQSSANNRQKIMSSVIPEVIEVEPTQVGVGVDNVPQDVWVQGGNLTVLQLGKEANHGFILFDTHDVPAGTPISGQILIYKAIAPPQAQTVTGNNGGQAGGGINAEPCSNVQLGGGNNQASVNCGPQPRVVTAEQRKRLVDFLTPLCPFDVFVRPLPADQESVEYAKMLSEAIREAGCNVKPPPSHLFDEQAAVYGLWIGTNDRHPSTNTSYLSAGLTIAKIHSYVMRNPHIPAEDLFLMVYQNGSKPQ